MRATPRRDCQRNSTCLSVDELEPRTLFSAGTGMSFMPAGSSSQHAAPASSPSAMNPASPSPALNQAPANSSGTGQNATVPAPVTSPPSDAGNQNTTAPSPGLPPQQVDSTGTGNNTSSTAGNTNTTPPPEQNATTAPRSATSPTNPLILTDNPSSTSPGANSTGSTLGFNSDPTASTLGVPLGNFSTTGQSFFGQQTTGIDTSVSQIILGKPISPFRPAAAVTLASHAVIGGLRPIPGGESARGGDGLKSTFRVALDESLDPPPNRDLELWRFLPGFVYAPSHPQPTIAVPAAVTDWFPSTPISAPELDEYFMQLEAPISPAAHVPRPQIQTSPPTIGLPTEAVIAPPQTEQEAGLGLRISLAIVALGVSSAWKHCEDESKTVKASALSRLRS